MDELEYQEEDINGMLDEDYEDLDNDMLSLLDQMQNEDKRIGKIEELLEDLLEEEVEEELDEYTSGNKSN